jgi:hypothetical protein
MLLLLSCPLTVLLLLSCPVPPKSTVTFVTLNEPNLTDKTMFQNYMVGVNGNCEIYDPPLSYWVSGVASAFLLGEWRGQSSTKSVNTTVHASV